MDPQTAINPDTIRIAEYAYFAGGIAVILIGGTGTIYFALGLMKMKYFKPYKNKYPYEQYKSFEEFASKKPAEPDAGPASISDPRERIKHNEEVAGETPVLTWENAPGEIESLTKDDVLTIKENVDAAKTEESADEKDEIPVF